MNDKEQSYLGIREKAEIIQEKIAEAAKKGQNSAEIKLVTVTKRKSVDVVLAAARAGLTLFGENYPEETIGKMDILAPQFPDLEWHMIGHLQSRKVPLVADRFHMIHSLDSVRLAKKLGRALHDRDRQLPVLLEMNVSGEATKGGWAAWSEDQWKLLIPEFEQIMEIDSLEIKGLMTMPPLYADAEKTRPYFIRLRQ
ncbi:MAG: YggS family pyridoxal phosphate-dependent enzyme, partial [Anaerolineaceae bacterium]|nr:YggS family pyridoxal phosphate-dependent enzyme [Anaerolineaceae bacterium]